MVYRSGPRWTTLQRLEKHLPSTFEPEDSDKMSFHRSKRTLRNGFSHHSSLSLATLECHAQLVTTGESCQTRSSTLRWGKCQRLQHNSASVKDCLRECGFVTNLRQTQTPLPSRKCALELPTQFIGQRNCGVPVCMEDQQSSSVTKPQPSGQAEANQHTFDRQPRLKSNCSSNQEHSSVDRIEQKSMGHMVEDGDGPRPTHEVIFSTEVPQNTTREQGLSEEESYAFSSKNSQRILRDQICRVVVNLEEVLRGLKEVHLEMKEVVQQIDQLTSNIDLGEEDAKESCGGSSSSRRVLTAEEALKQTDPKIHPGRDTSEPSNSPSHIPSTVPRAKKRFQASTKGQPGEKSTPRLPPPAYPTGHSGTNSLVRKSNHGVTESKGSKPEAARGHKSQKPPPYPFGSKAERANKGKDPDLKSPPYSNRRKLLSTTV
ncbi:uncharacterized protein LOC103036154 [Astyanax mexicanus]|uniref:uncharacterized protein LOC103036154 n=1 Tax=Astyanax mexicanus TaxID=7994 RepID=UPI0020CB04A3|nr:uncharacterized protein LOC103036154 [Astyanax mexicanus]